MAINLSKGQRVSLDKGVRLALVGLGWDTNRYDGSADFDLDASAFLLGANGKVRSDDDFIFYGNLQSKDGSVMHTGDNLTGEGDGDDETLFIDFSKVPADVQKIAITVTIYEAQERGQNFGQVSNAYVLSVQIADQQGCMGEDAVHPAGTRSISVFGVLTLNRPATGDGEIRQPFGEWRMAVPVRESG